jgi:hypothetical protein
VIPPTELPTEGDEQEIARLKAQRESDERRNKQMEDEYTAAIDAGKRRAQELNLRFSDWFFVISDEVFKKIHVTDSDLVTRPGQPQADPDYNTGLDEMILPFSNDITITEPAIEQELATKPKPEVTIEPEPESSVE